MAKIQLENPNASATTIARQCLMLLNATEHPEQLLNPEDYARVSDEDLRTFLRKPFHLDSS